MTGESNTAEFYEIYREHSPLVYNTALHFLHNVQEAEEATQDVFVKVFQNITAFRKESAPGTWIYRITVNLCLDFLRNSGRQKRRFTFGQNRKGTLDDLHNCIAEFDHPGVILEHKEEMKLLFAAIRRLPARQQAAWVLSRVEGLTVSETAGILGITTKATESLLSRARDNLLKRLRVFFG